MEYLVTLVIFGCINMVSVSGVTLLTGFTGLFSLGHAGFMAIGAYAATVLFKFLGVPYIFAIIIGGLFSVVASVIVGYPSLKGKLRGDYFAIAMLGFGEVVRLIISNTRPLLNGAVGISGLPKLTTLWTAIAVTAVAVFFMRNFIKSQYGRNCIAVQQQEIAAEMNGINILKTKLISLMISAFYAGLAGAMFAFLSTYINPSTFGEAKSTDLIAAVVIGGINSLSGPLIAAFILVILPEFLRFLVMWRLVIYGLVFVVIMLFRPEGLFGYKEISFKWLTRLIKKNKEVSRL